MTECVLGDLLFAFMVPPMTMILSMASIISILASKAVSVVYEKFPMFGLDVSISVGEILPNLVSYLLYGCNISFCSSFCSDIVFSLHSVFDCCFPGPSQGL